MTLIVNDTIAAIATPPGKGGIGIIRVSGPHTKNIATAIIGFIPKPRIVEFCAFRDAKNSILDEGIAIFFSGPNSFTGEDVLELQGHGGPVILDLILREVLRCGARLAKPGEFSERAFLNDKLDLVQAESIADLIDASSEQAARAAIMSLQGDFSKKIIALSDALVNLRVYVEAAIDFPDEEIDFLSDGKILSQIETILQKFETILANARQGSLLREGMTLVIAGPPNAGKSSLLNALSGRDIAIVTDIPGTTRDVLKNSIAIDGMPLHVIDTAGLRNSDDIVEQEGVRRAVQEIKNADRILLIIDSMTTPAIDKEHLAEIGEFSPELLVKNKITIVFNKIDCSQMPVGLTKQDGLEILFLSAKTGAGLDLLREHLKQIMGYQVQNEGQFTARRRHLVALEAAKEAVEKGKNNLLKSKAGELLAEELRVANIALGEIIGKFSSDDLLGKIFSTFCIGK